MTGISATSLARLQAWFLVMCNGDWEHTYGIKLETVDNPGRMLTIEIKDTPLWAQAFPTISECTNDAVWLHCAVSDGVFRASGGVDSLERILTVFLDWAETPGSV